MSNKENYFPSNTDINEINDTLYTDHMFLASPNVLGDDIIEQAYECIEEDDNYSEPPF